jgi:alkanesulfonate monooxygenase SsuD/methylene tetrahydromethanopterin reductase-like flavin-dependent oxidoreductase (luciferase family)
MGVSVFNYPSEQELALAQLADELGFGSVWLSDHVFTPDRLASVHPYPAQGRGTVIAAVNDFTSPIAMAAAIAASTKQIQPSIGVMIVPLRNPLLLARDLITIGQFAPGRIVFGAGAGWMEEEFEAIGVPFKQRISRLEESLRIVRAAAAGGSFSFAGKRFSFPDLTIANEPVEVPIILGGSSEPALRRAALLGDGWYSPGGVQVDRALEIREQIESYRAEAGPDGVAAKDFRYIVRVNPFSPDSAERFRAEGIDDLVLDGEHVFKGLAEAGLAEKEAALRRAAEEFAVTPVAAG